jgi:hypothetical protein
MTNDERIFNARNPKAAASPKVLPPLWKFYWSAAFMPLHDGKTENPRLFQRIIE